MEVNVNLVLCIHDVKPTTLRCETPEEEEEETVGEDDPAINEGTPEEDCARAASEESRRTARRRSRRTRRIRSPTAI